MFDARNKIIPKMTNYDDKDALCRAIEDLQPSLTEEEMRVQLVEVYQELSTNNRKALGKAAQNNHGHTPLISAVRKNDIKVLNALNTLGEYKSFDVNHQDLEGKTALMHAVFAGAESKAVVTHLTENFRADLALKDKNNKTAFQHALTQGCDTVLAMLSIKTSIGQNAFFSLHDFMALNECKDIQKAVVALNFMSSNYAAFSLTDITSAALEAAKYFPALAIAYYNRLRDARMLNTQWTRSFLDSAMQAKIPDYSLIRTIFMDVVELEKLRSTKWDFKALALTALENADKDMLKKFNQINPHILAFDIKSLNVFLKRNPIEKAIVDLIPFSKILFIAADKPLTPEHARELLEFAELASTLPNQGWLEIGDAFIYAVDRLEKKHSNGNNEKNASGLEALCKKRDEIVAKKYFSKKNPPHEIKLEPTNHKPSHSLIEAIIQGDLTRLETELKNNPSSENQGKALLFAVKHRVKYLVLIVNILLESRTINLFEKDAEKNTALVYAVKFGDLVVCRKLLVHKVSRHIIDYDAMLEAFNYATCYWDKDMMEIILLHISHKTFSQFLLPLTNRGYELHIDKYHIFKLFSGELPNAYEICCYILNHYYKQSSQDIIRIEYLAFLISEASRLQDVFGLFLLVKYCQSPEKSNILLLAQPEVLLQWFKTPNNLEIWNEKFRRSISCNSYLSISKKACTKASTKIHGKIYGASLRRRRQLLLPNLTNYPGCLMPLTQQEILENMSKNLMRINCQFLLVHCAVMYLLIRQSHRDTQLHTLQHF
ncbi:MAG: ankyrin repeat domain-containing protein, partial [Gammaproteobacteria bacterium]